jgi:predicted dehydrogenase
LNDSAIPPLRIGILGTAKIARHFGSYEALLADRDIDAVEIPADF